MVPNPDINGRKAILEIHVRNQKIPLEKDVNLGVLARGTPGFSGADLAKLVNEAALIAARNGADAVSMSILEDAKDRVMMGPARRSMILSAKEKLATAYHEAGHTLVARLLPNSDPVHKVTIIPRGMALGVTSWLPEEDRHSMTKSYCLAMIRVLMAGRAAEDIIYNEFTSGASNDLKRATQLAHKMVCEWGMSDLGPITFGSADEVFLGRDFAKSRDFSEETASAVDREIHRICEDSYKDSRDMLSTHEAVLKALADALFERETLDAEEIDAIIVELAGNDVLPERPKPPVPEVKEEDQQHDTATSAKEQVREAKGMSPNGAVPETA